MGASAAPSNSAVAGTSPAHHQPSRAVSRIVSGMATGSPADPADVQAVSGVVGVPTIIGSGITAANLASYRGADAFIIGSSVKSDGVWSGVLDAARIRAIVDALAS